MNKTIIEQLEEIDANKTDISGQAICLTKTDYDRLLEIAKDVEIKNNLLITSAELVIHLEKERMKLLDELKKHKK